MRRCPPALWRRAIFRDAVVTARYREFQRVPIPVRRHGNHGLVSSLIGRSTSTSAARVRFQERLWKRVRTPAWDWTGIITYQIARCSRTCQIVVSCLVLHGGEGRGGNHAIDIPSTKSTLGSDGAHNDDQRPELSSRKDHTCWCL